MGSCLAVVALCAGGFMGPEEGDFFPLNEWFHHFNVGLMEMMSDELGDCGDDTFGSSCGFPAPTFKDGALNVCCHNGICCYSYIESGNFENIFGYPLFIGCTNTSVNICEIETCLSEGDRCEDIEELICEDEYTNEFIDILNPTELCNYRPTESPTAIPSTIPSRIPSRIPSHIPSHIPSRIPSHIPSRIPSSKTAAPSRAPTDDDKSSSGDGSEIFSAAAFNVQSHLEKSFGILHSKQSNGTSGLDRIVYINDEPMTLREFISSGGELSDKMKNVLGPELVERYENIKNGKNLYNNAKKERNDDINILNNTKTKMVEISFGHYVFLSMFTIFGIIILSIGNILYWCCDFTFKKNSI